MTKPSETSVLDSGTDDRVQAIVDSFLQRRCNEQELVVRLKGVCRQELTATWAALSLLDRLHRRQVLSAELFRGIKTELNEIVFSSTGAYQAIPSHKAGARPTLRAVVRGRRPLFDHVDQDVDAQTPDLDEPLVFLEPANAMLFQPLRPGVLLSDRYLIMEPLLAGSASVTFKALDKQREFPSSQHVAIRWLDEHLQSDPHAIAALQNEFAHLQAITHANIPTAYGMHDAPGNCAIVMELPQGEFLQRIVERHAPRRLPVAYALGLLREIGLALAHAHARGVVHGNLHPGCVLVTAGGVRVYDFAQADAWANLAAEQPCRTGSLSLAARRYCSPQRLAANTARADDDLYSLAAIACELLCGWSADDVTRSGDCREQVGQLSRRQCRALRRALALTPAERSVGILQWLAELDIVATQFDVPPLAQLIVPDTPHKPNSDTRWFPSYTV